MMRSSVIISTFNHWACVLLPFLSALTDAAVVLTQDVHAFHGAFETLDALVHMSREEAEWLEVIGSIVVEKLIDKCISVYIYV